MKQEMETKLVWKFGTGHAVPATAKYLRTHTETRETKSLEGHVYKENYLVWHYYEVDQKTAAEWLRKQ